MTAVGGSSAKIVELQGIRCIAIISVLAYHIWPDTFINGFLGVDIFFALSGYFMALIYLSNNNNNKSNSESLFISSTLAFYYRRIYRILPLYLINIFVTILLVPIISYTTIYSEFISQIKSSLTFTTNFYMYYSNLNYFNKNNSIQWFKHYWSICVEMQFYFFVVPFSLFLTKKISISINLFLVWPLVITISTCLVFYMLINFEYFGAMFTFLMLPTRIWQFCGGFCAYFAQKFIELKKDDCKISKLAITIFHHSITINFLTILLLIVCFFPFYLDRGYTPAAVVIISSTLITSCGRHNKKFDDDDEENKLGNSILANKFCVFIGDASYALYISHWLLVTICKILFVDNEPNKRLLFLACILLGFAVHLFIEKPIYKSKIEPKRFLSFLVAFYLCIIFCVFTLKDTIEVSPWVKNIYFNKSHLISNSTEWKNFVSTLNPEISAELGLQAFNHKCHYYPQSKYGKSFDNNPDGGAVGAELQGNGSLKVLVIGNSHAECIFPAVKVTLENQYLELNLFVTGGVTPFEGFMFSRNWYLLKKSVIHYKPDLIYFIFKYQEDFDNPPTTTMEPIENDYDTKKVQEMITFLSENSKILFISEKHFEDKKFNSLIFSETMHHNGWVSNYKFEQKVIETRHAISTHRWKSIKCSNCIYINFLQAFCKDQWCSPVDEFQSVPLISDDNHLTIFGSYLLIPYLKEYLTQMNDILGEK